jgi:hypothetical protein
MNAFIRFNGEELCSNHPVGKRDLHENRTPFYEGMMRRWYKSSRGCLFSDLEVNGSV